MKTRPYGLYLSTSLPLVLYLSTFYLLPPPAPQAFFAVTQRQLIDIWAIRQVFGRVFSMQIEDLENRFAYHTPRDEFTKDKHAAIRYECLQLADLLNDTVPDGREKALAITHLEEVMMWANAAIARHPE